jgi:hypothetical protein
MFKSTQSVNSFLISESWNVNDFLFLTGLGATFLIEIAILRYVTTGIEQQTWMINVARSLFAGLAVFQFLHAIFTYR